MTKLFKVCGCVLAAAVTAASLTGAAAAGAGGSGSINTIRISDMGSLFSGFELETAEIPKEAEIGIYGEDEQGDETAFAIYIGGEELLYVSTEEDARAVIDGMVRNYCRPDSEIVETAFDKEISYVEKDIVTAAEAAGDKTLSETYICQVDEAVRYILNGTSTPLTYTVKGGDTLWDIAIGNNISVYELEEMNPGIGERLSIGQVLNLYQVNPFVNITVTEIVTDRETIPYGVSYTSTDELYKGQIQVQSPGQNGAKEVTAQITRVNGVETAKTIISEEIITEAVVQIALSGTKTIPVQTGSGQLQYPVASVEISSPYGASRGSRSHKGIDLRNPKGTPFMSADDGTVIFAGWGGGSYGNLITVDHGNGVKTKYAHCDSISVAVGDNVQKGQVIGTIGSTGNATGNVLHFEVIINGVQKNPVNYL